MGEAIRNVTDASFDADVLGSSVPVLVDYWAEWCAPCRMIGPLVEEVAETHAGRLKVVKVDADENPSLTRRYRVRSIPTLMLFRDGQPVASQVGALNRGQLNEFIESNLR